MITLEESEFLLQMIESVEYKLSSLESSYNSGDYEKAQDIKRFILRVQEKTNEIIEKTKK